MVRVMQQLREIYEKQSPYTFIPDETCQQARKAFDKGIECILRTQVRQNGELTVWCAQHDPHYTGALQGTCIRVTFIERTRI